MVWFDENGTSLVFFIFRFKFGEKRRWRCEETIRVFLRNKTQKTPKTLVTNFYSHLKGNILRNYEGYPGSFFSDKKRIISFKDSQCLFSKTVRLVSGLLCLFQNINQFGTSDFMMTLGTNPFYINYKYVFKGFLWPFWLKDVSHQRPRAVLCWRRSLLFFILFFVVKYITCTLIFYALRSSA